MQVYWSYDFFSWKCLHANMVLGWEFFTLFLWLFSIILKDVSLSFLHIVVYITYIHQVYDICAGTINFVKNLIFFEPVDSWKLILLWLGCSTEFCYFQNTGNISLVSKWFCLFSLQCCFRFCYCQWVPWDFSCVWKLELVRFEILSQGFVNW